MPDARPPAGVRPPVARPTVARVLVTALVTALVTSLALAGCSALPVDGPVTAGTAAGAQERRDLQVGAIGPVPGASAPAVLRGFLGAAVGVQDDFAAARSFLVGSAQRSWKPTARVVVHPADSRTVVGVQGGAVVADGVAPDPADGPVTYAVTVEVTAVVDDHGVYAPAAPGTVETVDLVVVQEDGQWRVADVPDQLLVTESDFALNWRPTPLSFSDSLGRSLVPEVRWFADRPSTATTAAVELLRGPSAWLVPATRASDLAGVSLTSGSVPVEDGVARVDLTRAALDLDTTSRNLLQRELEATVGEVPGVSAVRVTVVGGELGEAPALADDPAPGTSPVLVLDGALVRWDGATATPVTGLGPLPDEVAGEALSDPAVRGRSYAALAGTGAVVRWDAAATVTGTEAPARVAVTGTDLVAPSYDALGWLWTAETRCDGVARAASPDGTVVEVAAPSLVGRVVLSLQPSAEGARVAVASTAADGSDARVDVAAVERSSDGAPLALSAPSTATDGTGADGTAADGTVVDGAGVDGTGADGTGVDGTGAASTPALADVAAATWVDDTTVAVLGSPAASPARQEVLLVTGGRAEQLTAPPGDPAAPFVAVAAGQGARTLLVLGADGRVLQRTGAGWSVLDGLAGAAGASYPVPDPGEVTTTGSTAT